EVVDRMPRWFEYVMNTPSHHRVNHGRNARYLDANYTGTLIIWDRMFGSFAPEQHEEPVDYGLVRNLGAFNPLRVAFHEWIAMFRDAARRDIGWRDRLLYLLAPTGWSHDRSRKTTATLKEDYVAAHPEAKGAPGLKA
ncbi:MAG: sterol desaturase family protein, partial [Pseudomonadota bacterium]